MRDLPAALADLGWRATIVTPSYGMFATLPGAANLGSVPVSFRGEQHLVDVFDVPGSEIKVRNIVFEHSLFTPLGAAGIYSDIENEGPFETDASKFAFFGSTTATWIGTLAEPPDVVHVHDWHAAFYFLQRSFDHIFQEVALQDLPVVFTMDRAGLTAPDGPTHHGMFDIGYMRCAI